VETGWPAGVVGVVPEGVVGVPPEPGSVPGTGSSPRLVLEVKVNKQSKDKRQIRLEYFFKETSPVCFSRKDYRNLALEILQGPVFPGNGVEAKQPG